MPLLDPERDASEVAPEDAVLAVHAFLHKARAWATEREIPKRLARVQDGAAHDEAAKQHAWVVWRDFIDHALGELEDGTLDRWFDGSDRSDEDLPRR